MFIKKGELMKQRKLFVVVAVLVLLVSLIAVTGYIVLNRETNQPKEFYAGVTYCGSSVQEAKELIDKVKNYTNLFILQSGPLATNSEAINEIGDYACAANLNYAISGSTRSSNNYWINNITLEAKARWGEQFIGIYFMDEPGGKMLDNAADIQSLTTVNNITTSTVRTIDGVITVFTDVYDPNSNVHKYFPDGRITIQIQTEEILEQQSNSQKEEQPINDTIVVPFIKRTVTIDYYPNGTIMAEERTSEGQKTITNGVETGTSYSGGGSTNFYATENITKCPYEVLSYEEALKQHPAQTMDGAAEFFVNSNKSYLKQISKEQLQEESILVFTSDYGLYWWDYNGGYDFVLAELGWNNTVAQEIALVRGAANLQGKSWGTIITWKYTHAPFLADGNEIYEQMKNSYEAGAEYVLIFNYSEDPTNPNTLQEEHFQALERFWNDVVQNPDVKQGSIKAEAVLVLPQNYGWGMRNPQDSIWGIWQPDDISQQIWEQLQNRLDKHGLKLDIVFEDLNYSITGKYNNTYHWSQK
jgi:hypothetical protein